MNSLKVFWNERLAVGGSYGVVYKAKYHSLPCAVKVCHPNTEYSERSGFRRLEQEIHMMRDMNHPNIVQYLCTCTDPNTLLPMIVMELMDETLTHCLNSLRRDLPFHTEVNFCHDISLGLSFLHSNRIVHRNLCSNNILLCGRNRVKIAGLEFASRTDTFPRNDYDLITMCGDSIAYLPPEAFEDDGYHTEKMDCFSFGVVAIQLIIRSFPQPSAQANVPVSEIERRQNHISRIDPNHAILPVIFDCLNDRGMERLSSHEISCRIGALKDSPEYGGSVEKGETEKTEKEDVDKLVEEMSQDLVEETQQHRDKIEQLTRGEQDLEEEHNLCIQELQASCRMLDNQLLETRETLTRTEQSNLAVLQQIEQGELDNEQTDSTIDELDNSFQRQYEQLERNRVQILELQSRLQELEHQCVHVTNTQNHGLLPQDIDHPRVSHSSYQQQPYQTHPSDQPRVHHTSNEGFHSLSESVEIYQNLVLGIGSYGSVYKAQYYQLNCAAKIMHPTLFIETPHQDDTSQNLKQRFICECDFMGNMRHPNVVQFLGTYQDPRSDLPVLLMELMENNLTHFLENSPHVISYYTEVNFCHDIAKALSYLHSSGIIHRDLSSNNVLLDGKYRAKISDFGIAKLLDDQIMSSTHHTTCIGTEVYMPPEAVGNNPTYTEKSDCFSYGVIMIQVLSQMFPDPGSQTKVVRLQVSNSPCDVRVRVTEIKRRWSHIDRVDSNHPLLPIALECLADSSKERPTANELCGRIEHLKGKPDYKKLDPQLMSSEPSESAESKCRSITELRQKLLTQRQQQNRHIAQLHTQLQTLQLHHALQIAELHNSINSTPQPQHNVAGGVEDPQINEELTLAWHQLIAMDEQLETIDQQIEQSQQTLHANADILNQFNRRIQDLERPPCVASQAPNPVRELRWTQKKNAPYRHLVCYEAYKAVAVKGDKIYMTTQNRQVFRYNTTNDSWARLPDAPHSCSSLVMVGDIPTLVGGEKDPYTPSNKVYSLVDNEWRKVFPSMRYSRSLPAVLSTELHLIVAGGYSRAPLHTAKAGICETSVEVMSIQAPKWKMSPAPSIALYGASLVQCDSLIYMVGGKNFPDKQPNTEVTFCILEDLIRSSQMGPVERLLKSSKVWYQSSFYNWNSRIPAQLSSFVSLHGRLLAIGGRAQRAYENPHDRVKVQPQSQSPRETYDHVWMYDHRSDSWSVVGNLPAPRHQVFTAVFDDNKIAVIGGMDKEEFTTNTVDIATATGSWKNAYELKT